MKESQWVLEASKIRCNRKKVVEANVKEYVDGMRSAWTNGRGSHQLAAPLRRASMQAWRVQ